MTAGAGERAPAARSGRARFVEHPSGRVGLALVAFVALFALVGPLVAPHDPLTSDLVRGINRETGLPVGPSPGFWLGADRLFRDELARLATGARLSLLVGITATAIATFIGTVVGIVAGWFEGHALPIPGRLGRWLRVDVDALLMRAVDVGLSFPFLLLVMAIGASVDRTTVTTLLLLLGLTGWLGMARVVRAKTMQVRRFEFIDAARALGQTTPAILVRHVLPNVAGPIVVIATAQVAQMILAESVLSYLGAGVAPPTPTWGGMLSESQDTFSVTPWLVLAPATAILLTVLGWNLLGEGLRDVLDPREAR